MCHSKGVDQKIVRLSDLYNRHVLLVIETKLGSASR